MPIKHVATEELGLNTHVIDTFTGWTPPRPLDLVIAVSFGLFVPPRILALAKYGGLNLHPSLLPDLRGPAPIEHAILKGRSHTGVTVQTLDPTEFDRGIVLAQSPPPGCSISSTDKTASVEQTLSILGAEMLLDVLKSATFLTPMMDAGWYRTSAGPMDHAPKIVKQDRFIDFKTHTLADVQRIQRALGDPWCTLMNGDRLIIHEIAAEIDRRPDEGEPGIWVEKQPEYPLFRAACGTIGAIIRSTYAGHKAGHGNVKVLKLLKGMGT